jgi:uncharacterized membrane protein
MKKLFLLVLIFVSLTFVKQIKAQDVDLANDYYEEILEGEVKEIIREEEVEEYDTKRWYQELVIGVTKGSLKGDDINVVNGEFAAANSIKYEVGDNLVINYSKNIDGQDLFYIADYIRRDSLLVLFIIFAILAVAVGKVWGATSILGMGFSFLVIFKFILPQIIKGSDPVTIAIFGSLFIIPVTFYLSHGLNKKTHIAIIGTLISLVITGILANIFVEVSKLTGFASEEAGFLHFDKEGAINMKGILLAGIIIGTLGILDDVTVSQSAIVYQLNDANKKLGFGQLFSRAMKVGHDHVSSMVNTLVLVYTGAAMPLLLLFINNPRPFSELINYEIIADEIVRTLVGSIGLILAVPITTFIAAYYISETKKS